MVIYDEPVRVLLKNMIDAFALHSKQSFTREQAIEWFFNHYPKVDLGTIDQHLVRFSTNFTTTVECDAGVHQTRCGKMTKQQVLLVTTTVIALFSLAVPASATAQAIDTRCLTEVLADADDLTTVGELRALCRERPTDETAAPAAKLVPVYEQSAIAERLETIC